LKVTVNGELRELQGSMTVTAMLESFGLKAGATVVEKNGTVITHRSYGEEYIKEGDILELVRFVGGG
jgi:sulfur carrier protein